MRVICHSCRAAAVLLEYELQTVTKYKGIKDNLVTSCTKGDYILSENLNEVISDEFGWGKTSNKNICTETAEIDQEKLILLSP